MKKYSHSAFYSFVRDNRKLSVMEITSKCLEEFAFPRTVHSRMVLDMVQVTYDALPEPEILNWRLL